jgi:hypothetical protein
LTAPKQSQRLSSLTARPTPPRHPHRLSINASGITYRESATGVEFPLVQKLWMGDEFRTVGAGCRTKKIAIINVKVYAIALYVEAEKGARELGIRDRGGFFETEDDYCSALVDGGFLKALQIQLVRDVDGGTFVDALNEALQPRLSLSGELAVLDTFKAFFDGKKLSNGTNIVLLYRGDGTLDVVVKDKQDTLDKASPDLSIPSAGLCRALFEIYLGTKSLVPDAKKEWAKGAKELLDSDKVRRDTRKGGSG